MGGSLLLLFPALVLLPRPNHNRRSCFFLSLSRFSLVTIDDAEGWPALAAAQLCDHTASLSSSSPLLLTSRPSNLCPAAPLLPARSWTVPPWRRR